MSNWNNITSVTVKRFDGQVKHYSSFAQAVRDHAERIPNLRFGSLGNARTEDSVFGRRGDYIYWSGDYVIFKDDSDVTIPIWVLQAAVSRLMPLEETSNRPSWRRHKRLRAHHTDRFRKGSVTGVSCRRGGGGWNRRVATTQEIRENDFLQYDEEALEYGVSVRGDRRRSTLPNAWDDVGRSHGAWGKSWKRHRKTQWK